MVSFTALLVTLVASTTLAHGHCISDEEALSFSTKWLKIWSSNQITKKSQLRAIATSDIHSVDGTFGQAAVGIDALFASCTYVDPLVKEVVQKPEWVFHTCDEICVRWSYDAVATGFAGTGPAGKKIHFNGIEILKIDLKQRLVSNSTSSADWVQLALQTNQTCNI